MKKVFIVAILTVFFFFCTMIIVSAQTVQIQAVIITNWTGDGISTDTAFRPAAIEKYGISDFEDITSITPVVNRNIVFVVKAGADSSVIDQVDADTTFFVISQERSNGLGRNGKGRNAGLGVAELNRLRPYLISRGFSMSDFNFNASRELVTKQIINAARKKKITK